MIWTDSAMDVGKSSSATKNRDSGGLLAGMARRRLSGSIALTVLIKFMRKKRMLVEYYEQYYEPFNEEIMKAEYFGEKIKRFVLNEKELIEYWLYVNPGKKKITVKYGNHYFSDPIEQSLASEVQRGNIKLDYMGIPVVYRGA